MNYEPISNFRTLTEYNAHARIVDEYNMAQQRKRESVILGCMHGLVALVMLLLFIIGAPIR